MLNGLACSGCGAELASEPLEDNIVCLGVIDLVTSSLRSSVDANQSHACTETRINVERVLCDVWTGLAAHNVRRIALWRGHKRVHQLVRVVSLCLALANRAVYPTISWDLASAMRS